MTLSQTNRQISRRLLDVVLVFLVTAGALMAFTKIAHAQGPTERIQNYTVDIELEKDGSATVEEQITYDFGKEKRQGIYRNLPTQFLIDDGSTGVKTTIDILGAQRYPLDGGIATTATEQVQRSGASDGMVVVRLGTEGKFLRGVHVYTFRYTYSPLVLKGGMNDVFRFDAIPTNMKVPIDAAEVWLRGPSPNDSACYRGLLGASASCIDLNTTDSGRIGYSAAQLRETEGITIETEYTSGTFTQYAEVVPASELSDFPKQLAMIPGGAVAMLLTALGTKLRYGARRREETVIPQYEAPYDLKPAEVGLLIDNTTDTKEVTAAITYAAQQGFVKIVHQPKKGLFSSEDWLLVKERDFAKLDPLYADLLQVVTDGKDEQKISDVDKTRVQKAIKKFYKGLEERLQKQDFYAKTPSNDLPKRRVEQVSRSRGYVKALMQSFAVLAIAVGFWWFGQPWIAWALSGGAFGFLLVQLAPSIHKRVTNKGFSAWAEVAGFRDFLNLTEKDRIAFHEAPARTPREFSTFLPYAIALGVEKEWAKQFEHLELGGAVSWYVGADNRMLGAGDLSRGIGNFTDSTQSNFVSGAGSGVGSGSVGGGFGGGGGGSW